MRRRIHIFLSISLLSLACALNAQSILLNENCNSLGAWTNTGGMYPGNIAGYNWLAVTPTVPAADHTGGGGVFYINGNSVYSVAGAGRYILYRIESPIINLAGQTDARLEFWMQMRSEVGNWDGGFIEWSNDGGITWQLIGNNHLCVPYDGNMTQNPSSTPFYPYLQPAWWNPRLTWTRVLANVTPLGLTANCKVRFTFHSDEAANDYGWAIDDIRIVIPASIQAAGNGVTILHNAAPAIPPGTDYGSQAVGSNTVHTFYIRNTGTAPLTLTGSPPLTISGSSAFAIVSQPTPTTIPPGDSVAFQIAFMPGSTGTFNATLSIPHSDTYSACNIPNPFLINLTGTATNMPPTTNPIPDTTVCPGTASIVIPFTVSDPEQPASDITSTVTSSNTALIPNTNLSITGQPAASRQIQIMLQPGVTGTSTITLILNDGQATNGTSTYTFNVNVVDAVPPTALCNNVTVNLDPLSLSAVVNLPMINNGSWDYCGIASMSLSDTLFDCSHAGMTQTILTVTDLGGNTSQCTASVNVISPPMQVQYITSSYQGNVEVSCYGANDGQIQVQATGGCSPYQFVWDQLPGNNGTIAQNIGAGTYTIHISDQSGQTQTLNITLTAPPPLVNTSKAIPPSCGGRMDGQLHLSATGGVAPYFYTPSQLITGLGPGVYNISITDINGCQTDSLISLYEQDPIEITGITDYYLMCGDEFSPNLNITGGNPPFTYSWNYPQILSCDTCLNPLIRPDRNMTLELSVLDSALCPGNFQISIQVECNVFIPNAFTPNDDGINEVFTAVVNGYSNYTLTIFDRWGNPVYVSNSPAKGWDGTDGHGNPMQNDVYVYRAYIEMADGKIHDLQGRVTLVR